MVACHCFVYCEACDLDIMLQFGIYFIMQVSCPARLMSQCSSQHSVFSSTALTSLLNNIQDLLALKEDYTTRPAVEETINDPTNPKHYWRYRMCLCPLCCLSIPHSPPTSKIKRNIRVNFSCISVLRSKLKFYQVVKFKYTEKSAGVCNMFLRKVPPLPLHY